MRDGAENMEDQFAGGRGGIDFFFEAQQGDAAFLQHDDCGKKFGEGPSQPVEADDGQGVAGTGIGEQLSKAGPIHALARLNIGEHLHGPGLLEPHGLAGDILVAGADSGIAENMRNRTVSKTDVLWTALTGPSERLRNRPQNMSLYSVLSID